MIKPLTCHICREPLPPNVTQSSEVFPFCSERCRSVDLLRWSKGRYAIVEDLASRPDVLQEHLEELEDQLDETEDNPDYP